MNIPPSGEQIEISAAGQQATIVEVGGGLRSYVANGRPLLDGYAIDEICTSGRGQVLAPWPNRLEDGTYSFDGRHHHLPLTEPEKRNAIHGLVRWAAWTVAEHRPDRVVIEHVIHPQPGYPFTLALSIEYSLGETGLAVRTTASNAGREACPYAAGAHPYLTLGTPTVDSVFLRAPGNTVLYSDERSLPRGSGSVEGSDYDFRSGRTIGSTVLDHAFTDLERDEDGIAHVELSDPQHGGAVTLWVDGSLNYLMLFTGDTLPDVDRRSLAVEPMTCPPNAFCTGESVVRLEPGDSHTSVWGMTPSVRD